MCSLPEKSSATHLSGHFRWGTMFTHVLYGPSHVWHVMMEPPAVASWPTSMGVPPSEPQTAFDEAGCLTLWLRSTP